MSSLHLFDRVLKLLFELFGLNLAIPFLFVLLIDKLLLERIPLLSLLLKPGLLLDDEFLLALL